MKILITSGGTKVPIDSVRSITNMSSGTFGSKIARTFLKMGHEVVFFKAKDSKSPVSVNVDLNSATQIQTEASFKEWYTETSKYMSRYIQYEYSTFEQYADGLKFIIGVEQPDIILLAAAVSDYGVENYFKGKLRSNDMLNIKLEQLPKIISFVREWAPDAKIVGFKLLVNSKYNELIDAATRSLNDNSLDMVVANDLDDIKNDNHKVHLVAKHENPITYKSDIKDPDFLAKVVAYHSVQL